MMKTAWGYIYSFRHNTRTWRTPTDRQTYTARRHRSRLCIASRGNNRQINYSFDLGGYTFLQQLWEKNPYALIAYRSTLRTVSSDIASLKPRTHWRQSWIQHGRLCWKSAVPKPATNRQQSRLLPYTFNFLPIRSTLLLVLATNRQQREFVSLSRSTLLLIRSTLLPIRSSTVLNSTLSVCTGLKGTFTHTLLL